MYFNHSDSSTENLTLFIDNKKTLNVLNSILKRQLESQFSINLKLTTLQIIVAKSLGYNSHNDLVHSLSIEADVDYFVRSFVKQVNSTSAVKCSTNYLEKFKNKIALGLDAKDGNLSVSGWKENLEIKTTDFLKEVNDFGVSRVIFTDINRDGMKTSPNLDETVKIAGFSNCPVVISGGVSSINDIKKAKELNNKKIEGIIVGKAIYDGDIKLDELAKEINA